jgi:crotonobetainyl-CoA:carnitine CoA-transferase CaiB-like acyl-CoA transferase
MFDSCSASSAPTSSTTWPRRRAAATGQRQPACDPFDISRGGRRPDRHLRASEGAFAALGRLGHRPVRRSALRTWASNASSRAVIEEALSTRDRVVLADELQHAGVPAGLVRSVPEAIESAQANARHMVFDVEGNPRLLPAPVSASLERGRDPAHVLPGELVFDVTSLR